jgi:Holliday junction resolvase RusA-like endonuclease
MIALLDVTVAGKPVGASRPRVVRAGNGVRAYMPDAHVAWEERARQILAAAWRDESGPKPALDEPIEVRVDVCHHRPARLCRRKDPRGRLHACCKPDVDNVAKLVLDALVKANVLVDDTRVCRLACERVYGAILDDGAAGEPEGVRIRVGRVM